MHSDAFRCVSMRSDALFNYINMDKYKYILIYKNIYLWSHLMHSDAFLCVPMHSDAFRYVPMRSYTFRCVPMHSDAFRCVPMRCLATPGDAAYVLQPHSHEEKKQTLAVNN